MADAFISTRSCMHVPLCLCVGAWGRYSGGSNRTCSDGEVRMDQAWSYCHWLRHEFHHRFVTLWPHAGSRVERIARLRFLAGCHKRQLNQALSVRFLSLHFLSVSVMLLTRAPFCIVLFSVICVFHLLVVFVRLSVPVQVTDWKDSSLKWPIMCWWGR